MQEQGMMKERGIAALSLKNKNRNTKNRNAGGGDDKRASYCHTSSVKKKT